MLFAATVFTTLWAGALRAALSAVEALPPDLRAGLDHPLFFLQLLRHPSALLLGVPYALTVIGILGAHELGHFFACRVYRVRCTWPHFIPVPLPQSYGTFGAFIRIRSPIPSRRALFDIAVAGPLAGFVLCVPALLYGVWTARLVTLSPDTPVYVLGDSLLVKGLAFLRWGAIGPTQDFEVGAVFLGAWLGQLATCLNLFPVGQLDGGHLLYAVSARWHRTLSRWARWGFTGFLSLLALYSTGGFSDAMPWLLWLLLLFVVGDRHPRVVAWGPLGGLRIGLLVLAIVVFIVTFMPVPVRILWPVG
ncbi:MAG: site-2 protease family protein [Acidobacteriota bacterium]